MYSYKTGLGQVWVGSKLPPNPANNIIWLRPSDDHRVLWEIRTYNIYKERWEVLTSAALTADGLLILIRDLEKRCKSLEELKVVLYDTIQNLTPEEQKIARQNIGAISLEDLPPQVEVLQEVGSSTTAVMSQNAVTEELSKKASVESVSDGISAHNTSSTSHADIRELLNTCVGLPAYDSSSYKITFTTLAGATAEIDLPIEQLALRYNAETESIEFDNADGTTTSIPVSAFVKEYVGSIGDRIQVSIDENNVIHATILKNSIDWGCLSFELQERINDHVTSADFATKAVRTDIAQTLSAAQQEQAWSNLGFDLVVLKFPEGATSVTLTDEEDAKLAAGSAVLVTVDGTNTSTGVYNADNHIFVSYNFTNVLKPSYYSLWSNTSSLYCSYEKASKTFVYKGSLQLKDIKALRTDYQTSLTSAQQDVALSNIGLKWVNVPYSLLNTTLDDATYAKIKNANGLILTDASSEYYGPLEFICGANNRDGVKVFSGLNLANTSAYIILQVNHNLTNVRYARTYDGAVPYDAFKALTDTQKQQARANINAVGSSMIKGVEIVYGTAPMQEDNILYIELEETT